MCPEFKRDNSVVIRDSEVRQKSQFFLCCAACVPCVRACVRACCACVRACVCVCERTYCHAWRQSHKKPSLTTANWEQPYSNQLLISLLERLHKFKKFSLSSFEI